MGQSIIFDKRRQVHDNEESAESSSQTDAGEQTLAHPQAQRLVDYTEHDFAVRATLASTRLFWGLVMILIDFVVKFQ